MFKGNGYLRNSNNTCSTYIKVCRNQRAVSSGIDKNRNVTDVLCDQIDDLLDFRFATNIALVEVGADVPDTVVKSLHVKFATFLVAVDADDGSILFYDLI